MRNRIDWIILIVLIAVAGYGLYTSVLRAKIADDECASMQLLLGYMGLVNALVLSPVLVLMVRKCSVMFFTLYRILYAPLQSVVGRF